MTYGTTLDLNLALANNYIGEVAMQHTEVASIAKWLITGKTYKPWTMYYYGKPSLALLMQFGYVLGVDYPPVSKPNISPTGRLLRDDRTVAMSQTFKHLYS